MRGQAGSGKHHESAEYCPHRKRRRRKSANVARMYPHQSEHGAYKRVVKNGGASGIDGMTVQAMYGHLKEHYPELIQSLYDGSYRPQAVKRVEIPKADGGKRKLGIPTVIDRMIQQAISQVLTPYSRSNSPTAAMDSAKGEAPIRQ